MIKLLCRLSAVILLLTLPLNAYAQTGDQVTVVYYGKMMRTQAREETIGRLLERLELEYQDTDLISHSPAEPVEGGMTLRIDSILTRQEQYTETIPHHCATYQDPTLPEGTWEVLIPGMDGELSCTAEVSYINGKEVSRRVLTQAQTLAPVTEVVAMGTGPIPEDAPGDPSSLPEIGDGYIRLPTGEVLTYTATGTVRASAYTHTDAGCDMFTSTGSRVHVGTVAVDPRHIPYGTRMFIMARSGSYVYGVAEAEDCGGAIKGDRVDLYLPTYDECMEFGRRVCTVYYLG